MPSWPGGPCPECGENMPPNLIHCQTCRALLNPDLVPDYVEIPEFEPLEEIRTGASGTHEAPAEPRKPALPKAAFSGYLVHCPKCDETLKVHRNYIGQRVKCRFCAAEMDLHPSNGHVKFWGVYTQCPHCQETVRAASQFIGAAVNCNFCKKPFSITKPSD